jgi:hypothetical protein
MFSGNQWPSSVGDRGKNEILTVNNNAVNGKRDTVYRVRPFLTQLNYESSSTNS